MLSSKEIMALLCEAADSKTGGKRLNEIYCTLEAAMPSQLSRQEMSEDGGWRADGMAHIALATYSEMQGRHPELLPTLYPLFSLLCGNQREPEYLRAMHVDWSAFDVAYVSRVAGTSPMTNS